MRRDKLGGWGTALILLLWLGGCSYLDDRHNKAVLDMADREFGRQPAVRTIARSTAVDLTWPGTWFHPEVMKLQYGVPDPGGRERFVEIVFRPGESEPRNQLLDFDCRHGSVERYETGRSRGSFLLRPNGRPYRGLDGAIYRRVSDQPEQANDEEMTTYCHSDWSPQLNALHRMREAELARPAL